MNNLKHVGLRVFYQILKLHRKQLPQEMRNLGDTYVKQEFRLAHANANQEQYIEFIERWVDYIHELKNQRIGRNMTQEEEQFLSAEQKEALSTLKKKLREG